MEERTGQAASQQEPGTGGKQASAKHQKKETSGLAETPPVFDQWQSEGKKRGEDDKRRQADEDLAIVVMTAPGGFSHPQLGKLGYIPDRISIYTALLLCVMVGLAKPGKRMIAAFSVIAACFFLMLYFDTLSLDRMEQKIEAVVSPLQPGDRVVAAGFASRGRLNEQHLVDRACVGHCFYLANYEASSKQFRIKADPGNRIVVTSEEDSYLMQTGQYRVRAEDLPLKAIYLCGPKLERACIHDLSAGDFSGKPGG